jgi:hypothetical protein
MQMQIVRASRAVGKAMKYFIAGIHVHYTTVLLCFAFQFKATSFVSTIIAGVWRLVFLRA